MIKTPLIFATLSLCLTLIFTGVLNKTSYAQGVRSGYAYPYAEGEIENQLGEKPVVLELFSSQACMFCPMADQFIEDLVKRTDLIILACHIDYFDVRQGSIATPECSKQQKDYARMIRGATLYTPEIVLNGAADYVGYEFDYFMEEVVRLSKEGNVVPLTIKAIDGDLQGGNKRYELDLFPFTDAEGQEISGLDIWLYMVEKPHHIKVAEGANKGKNLPYVNSVRKSERIGRWDGRAQKVSFSAAMRDEFDSFVVLLKNDQGVIMGAAQVKL